MQDILPLLCCPETGAPLRCEGGVLISEYGQRYPITEGIPQLLIPTKSPEEEALRQHVQEFYETVNFPGYDDIDSPGVLMDKARRSGFGQWVDEAIPPLATVLEVGCGTGQMTNFLGLVSTRTVLGVDMSLPSLRLGQRFRDQFGLTSVHFIQGNIFAMPVREDCVDVLLCSGVLHHTPNPREGFQQLLRLVKPGGKVLIGLYNTYARIPTGLRQLLFRFLKGKAVRQIDAYMRRGDVDESKKEIWFADQYRNPHESWHSTDEALRWFDESGVRYLSCVPSIAASIEGEEHAIRLFTEHPRGTLLSRTLRQLTWMRTTGCEGGLFVIVGEKSAYTHTS